jgi:hypothetical protein
MHFYKGPQSVLEKEQFQIPKAPSQELSITPTITTESIA